MRNDTMNATSDRICTQCHAVVAGPVKAEQCPACGGVLIPHQAVVASPRQAPRTIDHRGIVLPARHAVGGIISPR